MKRLFLALLIITYAAQSQEVRRWRFPDEDREFKSGLKQLEKVVFDSAKQKGSIQEMKAFYDDFDVGLETRRYEGHPIIETAFQFIRSSLDEEALIRNANQKGQVHESIANYKAGVKEGKVRKIAKLYEECLGEGKASKMDICWPKVYYAKALYRRFGETPPRPTSNGDRNSVLIRQHRDAFRGGSSDQSNHIVANELGGVNSNPFNRFPGDAAYDQKHWLLVERTVLAWLAPEIERGVRVPAGHEGISFDEIAQRRRAASVQVEWSFLYPDDSGPRADLRKSYCKEQVSQRYPHRPCAYMIRIEVRRQTGNEVYECVSMNGFKDSWPYGTWNTAVATWEGITQRVTYVDDKMFDIFRKAYVTEYRGRVERNRTLCEEANKKWGMLDAFTNVLRESRYCTLQVASIANNYMFFHNNAMYDKEAKAICQSQKG